MWSITSKTLDLDALARPTRLLLATLVLGLAGCQNMGGVQDSNSRTTPAPVVEQQPQWLDSAAEDEPPQDVWERMRRGFQLQDEIGTNPRIERQRLWFASKPSYLESVSGRGSLYVHYVVERLEERDMPLELALLPVIESSYDPFAYSRSNAAGLWQFIPTTGRHYNLQQSSWYDGRRDITASTGAALNYLSRLHEMFNGDWLLALAAYNAGEGTVSRAIERNQKLGLPTDYWNLPLPQETQDYVPKLLALSQLVKAPEAYGINLDPIANEPYFEVVELKQRMDLSRLAALANIDADEMYQLNPAFKKRITYGGPQQLLVPAAKAELLTANLSMLKPQDKVDWQNYKVRKGDTLQSIARRYDLSINSLQDINNLSNSRLHAGQSLTLPLRAGEQPRQAAQPTIAVATVSKPRTYRVKNGDNMWQIAKANNVAVDDLKRWNKLSNHGLKVGQVLNLQGAGAKPAVRAGKPAAREAVTYYKVKKGDSMYMIAKRFNVETQHIADWNPQTGSALRPGQTLTLFLQD
ncbi:LysM peptidoglycan-binding domain-containing protein [Pseudomonas sp. UL073]|uniref:LysM peptidoglycan-binding domain-containing protein n=1 Tax=Zestomonas insulae TaxID=2809017 RepID=A0ABS2IG38_9GAMM|nr:LysM peptidoglycan-binding domain-containing protein [Pseudomonas insulae]MBM7062041.1 LysM peptidoglycan-binding domain-containing protein [Pseudomonas insulae]